MNHPNEADVYLELLILRTIEVMSPTGRSPDSMLDVQAEVDTLWSKLRVVVQREACKAVVRAKATP